MLSDEEKLRRLEKALEYGGSTHRVRDVVQMVRDGKAKWWPEPGTGHSGDGMIVTEIHEYPLIRTVHYWLIFGKLRDCLALEHDINSWAIEQGCTVATATGRKGWGRVSEPTGWKPWYPNFRKKLVA